MVIRFIKFSHDTQQTADSPYRHGQHGGAVNIVCFVNHVTAVGGIYISINSTTWGQWEDFKKLNINMKYLMVRGRNE